MKGHEKGVGKCVGKALVSKGLTSKSEHQIRQRNQLLTNVHGFPFLFRCKATFHSLQFQQLCWSHRAGFCPMESVLAHENFPWVILHFLFLFSSNFSGQMLKMNVSQNEMTLRS